MTDKKEEKTPPKKTMKQLVEEKAKMKPHHLSLNTKVKGRKGSNKIENPYRDHN